MGFQRVIIEMVLRLWDFHFSRRDRFCPVLKIAARKHDAVLAGETNETDIRSKADDLPLIPPARMSLAHFYDIPYGDLSEHELIIPLHHNRDRKGSRFYAIIK